jgi:hypothetical protein
LVLGSRGKRQNYISARGYVNVVPNKCVEFATLQGPKSDCFDVPITLIQPFVTVYKIDTHSSIPVVNFSGKRFPILSVITLHHAAAKALRFSTRLCTYFLPRLRPRRVCCRCRSNGLRHRRYSCVNCRSTRRWCLYRCLPVSKQHGELFHCHFYFRQPLNVDPSSNIRQF